MRLAVYSPADKDHPVVLTPDCMAPSNACTTLYGALRLRGILDLDEPIIQAIAHVSPGADEIEYIVHSPTASRAIASLMNRS